ncbi:MAG: protein kinase [Planctomycetes bacterium]|nr:protein kinase [Planctomycetota bacterium]
MSPSPDSPVSVQVLPCECGMRLPLFGLKPGDHFTCPSCGRGYAVPFTRGASPGAPLSPAPVGPHPPNFSSPAHPSPPVGASPPPAPLPGPTPAAPSAALDPSPAAPALVRTPLPPPPGRSSTPTTVPLPPNLVVAVAASTPTQIRIGTPAPGSRHATPFGATPAPSPTPPVRQFGAFQILGTLGQGGMGVVYKAHDPRLDRVVAIKVIGESLAADPEIVQRFFREARAAAGLNHPNVVSVHAIDELAGTPYLVMEHIDGVSLQDLLNERGHLPWPQACDYILQAARGLAAAAAKGIVHRDVKPSNIMVTREGLVKITDFGLAKPALMGQGVTQTGFVIGTPLYMAPEQGRGQACDFRADMYALGATLYHLVSGKPPYHAESPVDVLVQHASAPIPHLPEFLQTFPPHLTEVLTRLLAKDPQGRYASYTDLLRELETLVRIPTVYARFGRRVCSSLVDTTLLGIGQLILGVIIHMLCGIDVLLLDDETPGPATALFSAIFCFALGAIYFVESQRRAGQTLGKWATKIQLRSRSGRIPSAQRVFVRYACSYGIVELAFSILPAISVNTVSPFLGGSSIVILGAGSGLAIAGTLLVILTRERRALHDFFCGTVVVVKPELVRYWQEAGL